MSDHQRAKVMENAVSLIGAPSTRYRGPENGQSPEEGFDCSGFVTYVLKASGLHVPRYIGQDDQVRPIRHASEYWDHYGVHVDPQFAKLGDLVFFSRNGMFPTHIGILTYHGTQIHAPGYDDTFVEEAHLDDYAVNRSKRPGRQLYSNSPIGYKALTTVLDEPSERYHQRPLS